MPRKRIRPDSKALIAVMAALPPLILAATGWLQADTKAKEAEAKSKEAREAWDSYGEYVTDQLHRDEALAKALIECRRSLAYCHVPAGISASIGIEGEGEQGQVMLDRVAREEGWAPE